MILLASAAVTATSAAASLMATGSAVASSVASSTIDTGAVEQLTSLITSALPSAITTTTPVTAAPVGLPVGFEVVAIFAGALSGAMLGVNKRFDLTGVLMLAVVNGLGGGIIRDILLQDVGIFALENPRALLSVLAAAGLAAFFYSIAEGLKPATKIVDAFSLALFCLVGADKALVTGLFAIPAILIGMVTAIGGGVMRDVLIGEIPLVMRPGSMYAFAALVGTTIFVTLANLQVSKPIALAAGGLVAFLLRVGSLWRGWRSPEPVDITPAVTEVPRRILRTTGLMRDGAKPRSLTRSPHVDTTDADADVGTDADGESHGPRPARTDASRQPAPDESRDDILGA